jgi:hypothetical protein
LQEFTDRHIDAVVEAAEDGGFGDVGVGRRVEMEYLAHRIHINSVENARSLATAPDFASLSQATVGMTSSGEA